MPLVVDVRDLVISQLASKLLLADQQADDAQAKVTELEEKIKKLEEQLAVKTKNGAKVDKLV